MHTNNKGSFDVRSCRLRQAREKKRLQKKDFDKQLIRLEKRRIILWKKKQSLPWVPLKEPYQKGWKRFFVLREDVKRCSNASFYETLLGKINTTHYSTNKAFKAKRKRKARNVYVVEKQDLKEFSVAEFNSPKTGLTEKECRLFYLKTTWNPYTKLWVQRMAFKEPWRYVLKIRPHIITEVRLVDNTLEQEYQQLENRVERSHWKRKIYKLTKGRNQYGRFCSVKMIKPREQFNNNALRVLLDQCRDASVNQPL